MMALRRQLVLTNEEEELLVEHPERLRMSEDRSLVAEEERIFIHHLNPAACPSVFYLPKANLDRLRVDPPTVITLPPLSQVFPNRVTVVGQSRSRVCFKDVVIPRLYVWNVDTAVVEDVIDDDPVTMPPRRGFAQDAAYGFGHTATGSFKIIRFPFLLPTGADDEDEAGPVAYFDCYDSGTRTWLEAESAAMRPCDPSPDPAFLSRKYGVLFWKVFHLGKWALLAYDINRDTAGIVLAKDSQKKMRNIIFSELTFGCGSDGDVIACHCKPATPDAVQLVKLYTLHCHVDGKWRISDHSSFELNLPHPTILRPLIGLFKDEQQYLFFIRNDENIIGFKFSSDGILWRPLAQFMVDVSPRGVAKAWPLDPRIIPMLHV